MHHAQALCMNCSCYPNLNSESLVYQEILPTKSSINSQSLYLNPAPNIYCVPPAPKISPPPIELNTSEILQKSSTNSHPEQQSNFTGRKRFSPDEDAMLISLISFYGQDWMKIASEMKTRTSRQCRERWRFFLSPDLDNNDWSTDENNLLIAKYNEIGPHWKKLQTFFPKRSYINIRNHYRNLENAKKRSNTNAEHLLISPTQFAASKQNFDFVPQFAKINNNAFRNIPKISSTNNSVPPPTNSVHHQVPNSISLNIPIESSSNSQFLIGHFSTQSENKMGVTNKVEIPHIWDLLNISSKNHPLSSI